MIEHHGSILYGKFENEKCKMASTTKIMTAIIVIENAHDLQETVTVSSKAAQTGGSRLGLHSNDKITVEDLLYGLLLCSGNDAAVALAEYIAGDIESFANMMNDKAKELGLSNTNFVTPHGLDEEEHYTTAYELALIADYALNLTEFSKIVKTESKTVNIDGGYKTINNTNELLGALTGVYGVKTGFTNGANRCLVTAIKRGNMDIICVVLGADTKKDRTRDSIKLIEYAFANFEMVDLKTMMNEVFDEVAINTEFNIIKGIDNNLEIELEENNIGLYPVKSENVKDIKIEVNIQTEHEAPVYENTKVGSLQIKIGETIIYEVNIITKNSIAKKGIRDYYEILWKTIILNENFNKA